MCRKRTDPRFVEAIGIKERLNYPRLPNKGEVVLIFEYHCQHCDHRTVWLADPDDATLSPVEMLQNIIETFSSSRKAGGNKVSKSKISNKELEQFKKGINECNSHDDFLRFIGMDEEQIRNLLKPEEDDDDGSSDK